MLNVTIKQFILLAFLLLLLVSCRDDCQKTYTYSYYKPILMHRNDIRNNHNIKMQQPQVLQKPGKIYYKDNLIFINEIRQGIHIINNTNPANPQNIGFISILGNVDMAILGNTLYADSFMDLLTIDLSNLNELRVINRVEDVFKGFYTYYSADSVITSYEQVTVTQAYSCEENYPQYRGIPEIFLSEGFQTTATRFNNVGNLASGSAGKGGSMARFAIAQGYLYAVGSQEMQLFNLNNPSIPQHTQTIPLGWGIETIFPYQDKLFLGALNGMHIYDAQNPAEPVHLSTYSHILACDPVVVEGNIAYVTMRDGTDCRLGSNLLEVIDISDLQNPQLIKSYPMQNPHGLGIDNGKLFVCEGQYGLKAFRANDPLNIQTNLINHFQGMDAYDVIPLGEVVLLIGKDGLYQYDYSNQQSLKFLSKIPVVQ